MVFSCFAVYVLANKTRVVLYFESCMAPWGYKYSTTPVLFTSTYTAKQLKTIYYCHSYIIPQFGNHQIDFVPKIN